VLDEAPETPVVLVSGGVGVTPMVSMLESLVDSGMRRPVWSVHAARSGRHNAMGERIRRLAGSAVAFYETPETGDRKGLDYDQEGLITVDWLKANTPFDKAVFYLCGPRPFLRALVGGLYRAGVPAERVKFEFFGPSDELLAA
jgi:nitric oxide dioxygenase